jgi:2-polyprenyl-6-methoxyphenol hydroxylase-like FAD-dependent oxidoreductase
MINTSCCIAGGGPAGLMLGFLLARAGVDTVVLEKHKDFLRDFRGDTIHPSTMAVMDELGLLQDFLKLPHEPVRSLTAQFGATRLKIADLTHLRTPAPFIAMMPQWDFLNFLSAHGANFPTFRLLMQTEAVELISDGAQTVGVRARTRGENIDIRADLVVAADGRGSTLRRAAGLVPVEFGAPMDVMWFRISRAATDTAETQGQFDAGRIFIMLNRGEYWQCAYVIAKGSNARVKDAGLEAFRAGLRPLLPVDAARADEIRDWEQVKLLTVQVDRLERWWKRGFLCIGDAAHAMSPVGGVGVNLAVQDAVAAANVLAVPLRDKTLSDAHLAAVERRRLWPTQVTQRLQLMIQNGVIAPALASRTQFKPPLAVRAMATIPWLNRIPARLIGLGVRPEHLGPTIRREHV